LKNIREIRNKLKKGLCVAAYCSNKHLSNDRFCAKHRKQYQKIHNPVSYTFNYLKQNAKRRGKDFTLTLKQFKQFCDETNYIELKGKAGDAMSIDRIDNTKGYSYDNIQMISLSDNSKKSNYEYF